VETRKTAAKSTAVAVTVPGGSPTIDTAITLLLFSLPGRPNNLLSHFDD
jgi:hypothetical protein